MENTENKNVEQQPQEQHNNVQQEQPTQQDFNQQASLEQAINDEQDKRTMAKHIVDTQEQLSAMRKELSDVLKLFNQLQNKQGIDNTQSLNGNNVDVNTPNPEQSALDKWDAILKLNKIN